MKYQALAPAVLNLNTIACQDFYSRVLMETYSLGEARKSLLSYAATVLKLMKVDLGPTKISRIQK
jgi:hypothetical protein